MALGTVNKLIGIIQQYRFDLSDEKRLQAGLADALRAEGIGFEREVRLETNDVVDFMVGDIAVECKLRGQGKMDIYRQLVRYARHAKVKTLVLATNVSMGLPDNIKGKPLYYASLSRGWL